MKKINKAEARKLFSRGRTIYLLPAKANARSPWIDYMSINKRKGSFDKLVNSFEYYNCHAPFGNYAWYYIK
jgi:hypothetical protein